MYNNKIKSRTNGQDPRECNESWISLRLGYRYHCSRISLHHNLSKYKRNTPNTPLTKLSTVINPFNTQQQLKYTIQHTADASCQDGVFY